MVKPRPGSASAWVLILFLAIAASSSCRADTASVPSGASAQPWVAAVCDSLSYWKSVATHVVATSDVSTAEDEAEHRAYLDQRVTQLSSGTARVAHAVRNLEFPQTDSGRVAAAALEELADDLNQLDAENRSAASAAPTKVQYQKAAKTIRKNAESGDARIAEVGSQAYAQVEATPIGEQIRSLPQCRLLIS